MYAQPQDLADDAIEIRQRDECVVIQLVRNPKNFGTQLFLHIWVLGQNMEYSGHGRRGGVCRRGKDHSTETVSLTDMDGRGRTDEVDATNSSSVRCGPLAPEAFCLTALGQYGWWE
jgi:hypothetical protein